MKTTLFLRALALVITLTATALHAQVPQILSYQGRVAVGDPPVNFDGSGAFKFALVQGEGPTLLWKNDGSAGNTEPAAAVTLPVTKGLYSVLLGANMTAIPTTVFTNPDVRLRVWFNDGSGSQLLTPDQRIAAVGYAMVASTLQSGATISSSTAAPAASIANSGDNPAALKLSTQYRSWWLGQNRAPDALTTVDQFYIYDQQANATRLRIDTDGVIHGNGSGLTGVAASGLAPGATIPASALTGTITSGQLASDLTLSGTTSGTFSGDGSGLTNIPASAVNTPPPGMTLIPAGAFTMGNTVAADTDITDAAPVSTTVSEFYMDVTEVTLSQWQVVQQWATLVGGYTGLAAGGGKGPDHPVHSVNWYDCVKWCNARSEREGKTPVYYTDAGFTAVYQTGEVPVYANWAAPGYRLPTEAEWEKAARGGLSGKRFPWGDTISQKQANYYGLTGSYAYDQGPDFYNAIGNIPAASPRTSPVGSFAANGYGLHDMAGNVFEWCWDHVDNPLPAYAGGTDPHGANSGSLRVLRGGSWFNFAYYARCAYRDSNYPASADINFGIRAVLAPGQ